MKFQMFIAIIAPIIAYIIVLPLQLFFESE